MGIDDGYGARLFIRAIAYFFITSVTSSSRAYIFQRKSESYFRFVSSLTPNNENRTSVWTVFLVSRKKTVEQFFVASLEDQVREQTKLIAKE